MCVCVSALIDMLYYMYVYTCVDLCILEIGVHDITLNATRARNIAMLPGCHIFLTPNGPHWPTSNSTRFTQLLLGGDAKIEKLRELGDFDGVAETIGNGPNHGSGGSQPLLEQQAAFKGARNPGCLCWPLSTSLELTEVLEGKSRCLCSLLHFNF